MDQSTREARGHHRNASSHRGALQRRPTRGPLDGDDDPLSSPSIPKTSSPRPQSVQHAVTPPTAQTRSTSETPTTSVKPPGTRNVLENSVASDLPLVQMRHLMGSSNFHTLPVPNPPVSLPNLNTTPLSTLLSSGQFRAAAMLCALILSAPPSASPPLSSSRIISLWHTRLVCLCLLGLEHIAADESRILGDVIDGTAYRSFAPVAADSTAESVLPWGMRVLVVRLQARAEADLGRGIIGLYALAREARRRAKTPGVQEVDVWVERLKDLEIRVAGLLVEMGDLHGATRMLENVKTRMGEKKQDVGLLNARLALTHLQMGRVEKARAIVKASDKVGTNEEEERITSVLNTLIEAAEGNYDMVSQRASNTAIRIKEDDAASLHNLAICLLYSGQIQRARDIMREMTETGLAFPTLLFNLTTMFELSTDTSRELKMILGRQLLERTNTSLGVESSASDLKL